MILNKLTREELHEVLEFDEELSRFRWKPRMGDDRRTKIFNTQFAGKLAGSLKKRTSGPTYRTIYIKGVNFHEHRLVWLHHNNKMPELFLDHVNGDGLDNRITNLRPATDAENSKNMAMQKSNSSGYTGVSWHKASNLYMVRAWKNGRLAFGGYFKKEDLLLAAARAAELRASLGYSPTHGLTREQRKASSS